MACFCSMYSLIAIGDNQLGDNVKVDSNSAFIEVETDSFSCTASQAALDLRDRNEKAMSNREKLLSSIDERLIKSCIIRPQDVQRRLLSNSVELIDIRSPEKFYSYRVPGSINLSPYEIKTKASLKSKHLVLMGDKASLLETGLLCRELKEQGFRKVNIVKNGINYWKYKLIGRDAKSVNLWDLDQITPKEFTSLKSKWKWVVLNLNSNDLNVNDSDHVYGGLEVVTFDKSGLDKLKKLASSLSNSDLYGLLVVSANGEGYEDISKLLEKNKIDNVFYLDGGTKSYAKYLAQRRVFLARLKKGPEIRISCGNS